MTQSLNLSIDQSLRPWYAVATPHEDIRQGRLAEAVFAANLWAVVEGTAPEVYLDPEGFFRKTYLTTGLSTVLRRVAGALSGGGESADRIISLQTAFGGGKTHTLVALWHLAKHAERLKSSPHTEGLRKAIGGRLPENVKEVAVFNNRTCDATRGTGWKEGFFCARYKGTGGTFCPGDGRRRARCRRVCRCGQACRSGV